MDQPLSTLSLDRDKKTFLWKVVGAVTLFIISVVFSLYLYAKSDSRTMLVLSLVVTLIASCCATWILLKPREIIQRHPIRFFGVVLFCVCTVFALALSPFAMPDEHRHYQATYWTSDCLLGQADFAGGEAFVMRLEDFEFTFNGYTTMISNYSYLRTAESFQLFSTSDETVLCSERTFSLSGDPIQSHLGATIGLTIGRLLNLGAVPTFYLGRLGATAVFVLAVMWALKVIPFGQRMLMAVCFLPITVSLAVSYSYDSSIIALSILSVAYLLRAIYGEGLLTHRDIIPICLLACLLSPMKVIYALLFIAVFFIPNRRFENRRLAWSFRLGILALIAITVLSTRLSTLTTMYEQSTSVDTRGDEEGVMYSITTLLQDPVGAVLLFLRSFDEQGSSIFLQVLGSSLGSLQAALVGPAWLCIAFFAILCLSSVRTPDDSAQVPLTHGVLCFVLGLLGTLAVWLAMCLGWTFIGEVTIQGVQGRYLIPYIPFFMLICRCCSVTWNKKGTATAIVSSMAYLNLFYVMWIMATGLTL